MALETRSTWILSGVLVGIATAFNLVFAMALTLPYFQAEPATEGAFGELGLEYYRSHYFDGGFGVAMTAIVVMIPIGAAVSFFCFSQSRR